MPTPPPDERLLVQHNAITTARYEMSACEMDIVFALLAKLRPDDERGTLYQLRVQEMEQLTGRQWNYQQLLESTDKLRGRGYTFQTEQGKGFLNVGLLASAQYFAGQGVIELEISEKVRPYLLNLKSNFTTYKLQAALSLTSKFAKRIYQLASQWKDVGETKTYTLHDLKVMLHLKDPKGKQPEKLVKFSSFERDVLKVATQQINEHTDLHVSYELIKQSRAYHAVRFFVEQQQPRQLPLPFDVPADEAKERVARAHLDRLGIVTPHLVKQILSDKPLLDALFQFVYKVKTDQIKPASNPGGLFLKMHGLR